MTASRVREQTRLVSGLHSVRSVLRHGPAAIREAWVDVRRRDRRLGELLAELRRFGIPLEEADRETLDRLSEGANHQGIVVRALAPAARDESDLWPLLDGLSTPPWLLVLDGVQDPHNLGACLRTAEAVGVDAVVAPRDRSVGLTPVAVKVASGAAERVPFFQVTNLVRVLRRLGDDYRVWVVGTAGDGETGLYEADLSGALALVMGGEGEGMRRLTREHCDQVVSIPLAGSVESLNVSVATGVCLYEALRQRRG
jgi:23S rRNA (guanosine2251-2'-O)-methyltransferase